jgi:uncharacterized 2Fe-2S/4Fe-4S cluster protein (DUF4445 family)
MIIGCIRTGLAQQMHAELYKTDIENILSNIFLSALGSAIRKFFHSTYSILLAIRNEGMVLPMSIYSVISYPKVRNNYDDS